MLGIALLLITEVLAKEKSKILSSAIALHDFGLGRGGGNGGGYGNPFVNGGFYRRFPPRVDLAINEYGEAPYYGAGAGFYPPQYPQYPSPQSPPLNFYNRYGMPNQSPSHGDIFNMGRFQGPYGSGIASPPPFSGIERMYGNYGGGFNGGGYGNGGYGNPGLRGFFGGPRRRPLLPQSPLYPDMEAQEELLANGGPMRAGYGYSYAGYIERQANMYPIMMYTLVGCVPCQRAKHVLAVSYADVRSHFLELAGDEEWQRQLQVDLQHITGALTFPYIFICGSYIGGSSDLLQLHANGQLRQMVNACAPH